MFRDFTFQSSEVDIIVVVDDDDGLIYSGEGNIWVHDVWARLSCHGLGPQF